MSYTLDLRGYDLWEEIQTAKAALEKGYRPEKGPVQQFECAHVNQGGPWKIR